MTQPPFSGNNFRDQIDSVARNLTGGAFRLKRDDPEAPNKFMDFVAQSEQEFMQVQPQMQGIVSPTDPQGTLQPRPQAAQPTRFQTAQPVVTPTPSDWDVAMKKLTESQRSLTSPEIMAEFERSGAEREQYGSIPEGDNVQNFINHELVEQALVQRGMPPEDAHTRATEQFGEGIDLEALARADELKELFGADFDVDRFSRDHLFRRQMIEALQAAQPTQVNPGLAAGQRRAGILAQQQARADAQPSMGLLETFLTQTPLGRGALGAADLHAQSVGEIAGGARNIGRILPDELPGGYEPIAVTQRQTEFDRVFQDARSRGLRLSDAFREARETVGFEQQHIPIGTEETGRHGFLGFAAALGNQLRGDLGQTNVDRNPLFEVGTTDLAVETLADPLLWAPGVGEAGQVLRGTRAAASGARRLAGETAEATGREILRQAERMPGGIPGVPRFADEPIIPSRGAGGQRGFKVTDEVAKAGSDGSRRFTVSNEGSTAQAMVLPPDENGKVIGSIVDFETDPSKLRQGFGEALVRDTMDALKERGATSFEVFAERGSSPALFSKLGFTETGVRNRFGDREMVFDLIKGPEEVVLPEGFNLQEEMAKSSQRFVDDIIKNEPEVAREMGLDLTGTADKPVVSTELDEAMRVLGANEKLSPEQLKLLSDSGMFNMESIRNAQLTAKAPTTPARQADVAPRGVGAEPKLPAGLKRSSPRWKNKTIEWDSDVDKALYIVANPRTKSKAHDKFMDFLRKDAGLSREEIRILGPTVRDSVTRLGNAESGNVLRVPSLRQGALAESPTTPVTRQQGAVSQAAEEVAQPQLMEDVTLPPELPPARPIATGGKPRDWSKVPDTGRQGVLLEVPPTEIGKNLLDLRPIQVRELGVVDRSLNVARATLGKLTNQPQVLKNKIVNAAFAEVGRVQSRITSQANLKSAVISRHAKAFVTDKQGRIPSLAGIDPSLPGAPTIQDVAARRPRYLAALTEEQKDALEQIRLELDDYRKARKQVGIIIPERIDIVAGASKPESGFYIPRGGNPLTPDLPRSTRQTGGRIGAEQRAAYDSMAEAIDDGATYFPLGDTIKNFGQTLGERLANQHAANFLQRLEVETGIPLGRVGGKKLPGEPSTPAGSAVPTLRELRGTTFPAEITNAINEILATQGELVGRGSEVLKGLNAYNNFYRGARSTADNSAIMIQGLLGSATDPEASARALLLNMEIWRTGEARTIFGKFVEKTDQSANDTLGIPNFSQIAAQKGLILNGGETELTQSLVTRLPGARRASNAFGFYGDALRLGWLADEVAIEMSRTGKTGRQIVDDGILENLAKAINAATGMSEGNRFTDLSSLVLFAPRFLQSRLITVARGIRGLDVDAPLDILPSSLRRRVPLSPAPLNPAARLEDRIARKSLIRLIGWGAAITVGANAAQGQETDFRLFVNGRPNPNFMRIRFGERDYSAYGTWDSILKLIIGTAQGLSKGQLDAILDSTRGLGSGLVVQAWDFISRRDFEGRKTRDTPVQFAAHITRSHLPFQAEELPAATGKIIQGTREGDIGQIATGAAQIALEGHGAKSSPLSRGDQLDILAKSQLGKSYSEINLLERFQLESDPEIAPLLAEIDADLAARGRVSAEYRVERANAEKALKDFQKQDLDEFIKAYSKDLAWKQVRGSNRIYAKIGDREITMRGLLDDFAENISQTKANTYANLAGWRKAKGLDNYVGKEPTNDFDQMLDDWYALLDKHTDTTLIGESEYKGILDVQKWVPESEDFISKLTPELQQQLAEWRGRKENIEGVQALLDLRGPIGKKADGSNEFHSDRALYEEINKILTNMVTKRIASQ